MIFDPGLGFDVLVEFDFQIQERRENGKEGGNSRPGSRFPLYTGPEKENGKSKVPDSLSTSQ